MAKQPSPLLPRQPEQQPNGYDTRTQEPGFSADVPSHNEQLPQKDTYESIASADVIREKIVSEAAGLSSQQTTQTTTAQGATMAALSPRALSDMTPEDQVKHLVDLAHKSGLDHAYKLANATNNAYVIDRFHDELVNRVMHNKQQSM